MLYLFRGFALLKMADVVKRTLTKFRRKDFPTLLERWNFGRRLGDVDLSGSKASIVKRIATLCLVRTKAGLQLSCAPISLLLEV